MPCPGGPLGARWNALHLKLIAARLKTVEVIEAETEARPEDAPLVEILDTLAANLTPVGKAIARP